jgi:hypothetical protein
MTDIKESDFVPELEKKFSEIFGNGHGCPECHKGFIWQNPAKHYPDCSNVHCTWGRKKRRLWV